MRCEGAVEGVHQDHCMHDRQKREEGDAPGYELVCCRCGVVFFGGTEPGDHGEHAPPIVPLEIAEAMAQALENISCECADCEGYGPRPAHQSCHKETLARYRKLVPKSEAPPAVDKP